MINVVGVGVASHNSLLTCDLDKYITLLTIFPKPCTNNKTNKGVRIKRGFILNHKIWGWAQDPYERIMSAYLKATRGQAGQ
jgi:hypothetical protein